MVKKVITIKKILMGLLGTGLFYGLMFAVTDFPTAEPLSLPATPPATPPTSTDGHSTGGVWAKAGNDTLKLTFSAHGGDVKGMTTYSNSLGDKFSGKVDVCYNQSGDTAAFAGTINKGNVSEKYFLVEVQDNGEGKKANPDRVRVRLFADAPNCTLSGVYPAEVTRGNLKVH